VTKELAETRYITLSGRVRCNDPEHAVDGNIRNAVVEQHNGFRADQVCRIQGCVISEGQWVILPKARRLDFCQNRDENIPQKPDFAEMGAG